MATRFPSRLLPGMFTVAVRDKAGRVVGTLVGSEAGLMGLVDPDEAGAYAEPFREVAESAGIPVVFTEDGAALGIETEDYAPDFVLIPEAMDDELAGIFSRIRDAATRAAGSIRSAMSRAGIRLTVPTASGEPILIDPGKVPSLREVTRSVGVRVEVPASAPSQRVTRAASFLSPGGLVSWYGEQSLPVKLGIPLAAFLLLRRAF